MKHQNIGVIFILCFLLSSCAENREEKRKEIKILEDKFYAAGQIIPNDTSCNTLVHLYASYALAFPQDSSSPVFLFKAGEIANGTHQYQASLDYFNLMCEKYPDHQKAPYAWFFKGFIYENMLADSAAARKAYSLFLQKFPKHVLAHDVHLAIKNLGKNPLDIVHGFEKANSEAINKPN